MAGLSLGLYMAAKSLLIWDGILQAHVWGSRSTKLNRYRHWSATIFCALFHHFPAIISIPKSGFIVLVQVQIVLLRMWALTVGLYRQRSTSDFLHAIIILCSWAEPLLYDEKINTLFLIVL